MTEPDRSDVLQSAGVPNRIVSAWDTETHDLLCIAYAPPQQDIADALATEIPELLGVAAAFEQNGEAVIGYLPDSNEFVRFYYEDGPKGADAIELMGVGYQQFAATILLEYVESALTEKCRPLSSLLEFDSAAEFMIVMQ